MIDPGFKPYQCLLTGTWKRRAWWPAWPPKRSAGVAPEANLWEYVTCMPPPSTNKAAHSVYETQRRRYQKSKILLDYLWSHKKDLCPPKINKKLVGKMFLVLATSHSHLDRINRTHYEYLQINTQTCLVHVQLHVSSGKCEGKAKCTQQSVCAANQTLLM